MKQLIQHLVGKTAMCLVRKRWAELRPILAWHIGDLANYPPAKKSLIDFLIVGEDHRHGKHLGFDIVAIARAVWRRLTTTKKEGASTIAQQLVRTLTNRRERTIRRKLTEILLAVLVTADFDSDAIARAYLKVAYYGWRMNNLHEACSKLGIDSSNINDRDAAGLIARLKYPQPQNIPAERSSQIRRRTTYLLSLSKLHRSSVEPETLTTPMRHEPI